MHTALDSLVQLTTDYERERYENLMIQRRQLFLDIMGGERLKDVQDRLTALDPFEGTREFDAFVVFAAEINTADELKVLSRQEQNLLKFALTHVISDLMAEKQLQAWSEWVSGQRLAVLIGLRRQPSEDSPQQLLELAKGCHSWILDNLRLSLTFGVGHSVNRLQDIHLSYTAAAGVLSHRLSLGTEIAAVHMDRQEEPGLQSYKYFDNFTRLVREFRLSGENWRSRLEEILSSFRKDRLKDEKFTCCWRSCCRRWSRS